jgi:hypothetical protein
MRVTCRGPAIRFLPPETPESSGCAFHPGGTLSPLLFSGFVYAFAKVYDFRPIDRLGRPRRLRSPCLAHNGTGRWRLLFPPWWCCGLRLCRRDATVGNLSRVVPDVPRSPSGRIEQFQQRGSKLVGFSRSSEPRYQGHCQDDRRTDALHHPRGLPRPRVHTGGGLPRCYPAEDLLSRLHEDRQERVCCGQASGVPRGIAGRLADYRDSIIEM